MDDTATWAGGVIAAASFVVSVIALVKSGKAQHKASSALQRIADIEEQREQDKYIESTQAKLIPQLRQIGGSYRLYLVNQGAAEARNIRIDINRKPLAENNFAVHGDLMPDFVGPKNEISCLLAVSLASAPPFEINLAWDDDSGENRTYRTALTW